MLREVTLILSFIPMWLIACGKKKSSSINIQHMIFAFFSIHLLLIYPILILWVWHDKGSIEFVQTALRRETQALVAIAIFLSADIEAEGWM